MTPEQIAAQVAFGDAAGLPVTLPCDDPDRTERHGPRCSSNPEIGCVCGYAEWASEQSERDAPFTGCIRLGCFDRGEVREVDLPNGYKLWLELDHCERHAALTPYLSGTDANGSVWHKCEVDGQWEMP